MQKRKLCGQASIEYSAVLAAMLISLVLVVIILTSVFAQDFLKSGHTEAEHTVNLLATSAKEAYSQGEGARFEVKQPVVDVFGSIVAAISLWIF